MRLKTLVPGIAVALLVGSVAFAAPTAKQTPRTVLPTLPTLDTVAPDGGAPDLPRVAKNQRRARTNAVDDGPYDPDFWEWDPYLDGGAGGWTQTGCNCNRNCVSGSYTCSLAPSGQCKRENGACADCTRSCP